MKQFAALFHALDATTAQSAKLATELRRIVSALRDPERFARQVRTLGRRHHGYGVVPAHYDVVGAVLVETFQDQLGAAFTPELQAAWTVAYAHVAAQMVAAAAAAEPVPA